MERKCFHIFILLYFHFSQFTTCRSTIQLPLITLSYLTLPSRTPGTHCKSNLVSYLYWCCSLTVNTAASISHSVQTLAKIVVKTAGKLNFPCGRATFKWNKAFKSGLSKFYGRHPFKNLKGYDLQADHISSNCKAVYHKIYLVHSWILCPKCLEVGHHCDTCLGFF